MGGDGGVVGVTVLAGAPTRKKHCGLIEVLWAGATFAPRLLESSVRFIAASMSCN